MPLIGDTITWREDLRLEVLEGANELRILLCREKNTGTKKGTSVLAACGIFVNEIIDAVPIDKYFEMFKPNQGGEGGFIRIGLDFAGVGAVAADPNAPVLEDAPAPAGVAEQKKRRVLLPVLLSLGVVGAGAAAAVMTMMKRR
ncbi:hypothetical protein FOA52_002101 [Chlamydomonas sp. UWO 241]|nr:hypothetical protein FOA52_002101 [Chlamydomonas sp. UWO 241]